MEKVKGDLIVKSLNGEFNVIIHGCNCFNIMGAGIAKQVKCSFPEAYELDQNTIKGDKNKLGTISYCYIERYKLFVVNAYTQYNYGSGLQVDYEAIRKCFIRIKQIFGNKNYKIAMPKIGCGLGGGDWDIIKKIISEEMLGERLTLVYYN